MPFQQLYYTSCEHGLGRYGGYQFNAVTPGVSPAVLREVEERTVYEPPSWRAGEGADEPEAYPVAFSYGISEATGAVITANVVFTGTDYSGRPGNYFAHALVTSAPERDFGPLVPAELWGAALWRSTPVAGTELPELAGPPAPGIIDRPGVQSFLLAREAEGILPELLSAVGRAIAGDRPVLIVTEDVTETAWWIAAVSYLLGEPLARRMTFTTYSHRPDYARYHLTGALPGMLLPEAHTSFQIFDFAAGRTPGGAVHPLAAILASTGVTGSPGLWQQAAAFASGAEAGLDDWLAPVAVAAGLLGGGHLTADQADAVARWLPDATRWMPPRLADVGLGVMLAQPDGTLTDERLSSLLEVARRLPAPPRVEHLERLLALRAIAHIARDEPAVPVALSSPAVSAARNVAISALERATAAQAVALLTWAGASGITLPEDRLRQYGRTRLGPDLPPPVLAGAVRSHPAVRRGFLDRLADEPPETATALLSGPVGTQLRRADLGGHPELTELWLLESVARGERQPLRAFDEIVDLRAARLAPRLDATLLHLLWPRGCPPEDLTELLGVLTDSPAPDVTGWFAAQLEPLPVRATASDQWLGLAEALTDHPVTGMLPARQARQVRTAIRVLPLLRRARAEGPRGNADAFARLFEEYATADDNDIRGLLKRELPAVLAAARPLGEALRDCPDDLAAAFCLALRDWLALSPPDTALARQVFLASGHPDVQTQPALSERLTAAFEQVRQWSRSDLHALARSMDGDLELARSFQRWRKAGRGDWPRRLLGGTGPSAPGT